MIVWIPPGIGLGLLARNILSTTGEGTAPGGMRFIPA
jgi:hypothetical protein